MNEAAARNGCFFLGEKKASHAKPQSRLRLRVKSPRTRKGMRAADCAEFNDGLSFREALPFRLKNKRLCAFA